MKGWVGGGRGGQSLSEYLALSAHLYSKGNLILKIELGRGDEGYLGAYSSLGRGSGRGEDRGGGPQPELLRRKVESQEKGGVRAEGNEGQRAFSVTFSPFLASQTLAVTPAALALWAVRRGIGAEIRGRPSSALACLQAILRTAWLCGTQLPGLEG